MVTFSSSPRYIFPANLAHSSFLTHWNHSRNRRYLVPAVPYNSCNMGRDLPNMYA